MAKKQPSTIATGVEVVEDLHAVVAEDGVEFTDVTGKDDLPPGVVDLKDEAEDEPEKQPKAKSAKTKSTADDEIPEDLKGKTPAQLAKMYRDAQALIGRQGSELGDLRRAADKYITAHLTRTPAPAAPAASDSAPKVLDDIDYLTNPKDAIARAIAEHPALKKLEALTTQHAHNELTRAQKDAERSFRATHPDAETVLADEKFREWVVKSPVRQNMLLRAHKHYDLDSANELFNTWKELQAARAPAPAPTPKPAPKSAATAAAARVPTGGNAAPQASGGTDKIYRRADVIRLMETDPRRYELMADEITKAYEQGRVR